MRNTLQERVALAFRLKAERERARGVEVTQADLADACGIKPPSVNAWFSGDTKTLKASTAIPAARWLGCDPGWLAAGEGPRPTSRPVGDIAPAGLSSETAPAPSGITTTELSVAESATLSPRRRKIIESLMRLSEQQEAAVLALLESMLPTSQTPPPTPARRGKVTAGG